MRVSIYNIPIEEVLSQVRARRVLLQLPDGLKPYAIKIAKAVQHYTGGEVFVSSGGCYGPCDVAVWEARRISADVIVHIGHAPSPHAPSGNDIKIIYIEGQIVADKSHVLEMLRRLPKDVKRVGLAYVVQYRWLVGDVVQHMRCKGREVVIGPRGSRCAYPGQVLGCDYTTATHIENEVDAFLLLASGTFHAIGMQLCVKKPVFVLDPLGNDLFTVEKDMESYLRRRTARLAKLKDAKRVALAIGTKTGQLFLHEAQLLAQYLKEEGKEVVFVTFDEFYVERIGNFTEVDAYVVVACPRIEVPGGIWGRPVIPYDEILTALQFEEQN